MSLQHREYRMNLMVSTIRGVYIYWLRKEEHGWRWVNYATALPHGPLFRSLIAAVRYGKARGDVV